MDRKFETKYGYFDKGGKEYVIKGVETPKPGIPESFEVLVNELNGLCLDVELSNE